MNKSTNAANNQQNFTLKVTKREDGKFEASTPNHPKHPPVVANSSQVAVSQLNAQLQKLNQEGKLE